MCLSTLTDCKLQGLPGIAPISILIGGIPCQVLAGATPTSFQCQTTPAQVSMDTGQLCFWIIIHHDQQASASYPNTRNSRAQGSYRMSHGKKLRALLQLIVRFNLNHSLLDIQLLHYCRVPATCRAMTPPRACQSAWA